MAPPRQPGITGLPWRTVLTTESDQQSYRRALAAATAPGAVAVIGCFAPRRSAAVLRPGGRPHGPGDLAAGLGPGWGLIAEDREEHITPNGLTQPFTWIALRCTG
jgi:hypothetical protein